MIEYDLGQGLDVGMWIGFQDPSGSFSCQNEACDGLIAWKDGTPFQYQAYMNGIEVIPGTDCFKTDSGRYCRRCSSILKFNHFSLHTGSGKIFGGVGCGSDSNVAGALCQSECTSPAPVSGGDQLVACQEPAAVEHAAYTWTVSEAR